MNPYDATSSSTTLNAVLQRPRRRRIVGVTSVAVTAIAMPCTGLWTIMIINSLVVSNTGFWMIILLFFCVMAAIPFGLIAMLVGRTVVQTNLPFRIVLFSIFLVATFPLTYETIAFLAVKRIEGFWLVYASLLAATGMIPFILGTLVYCLGDWMAAWSDSYKMAEQTDRQEAADRPH